MEAGSREEGAVHVAHGPEEGWRQEGRRAVRCGGGVHGSAALTGARQQVVDVGLLPELLQAQLVLPLPLGPETEPVHAFQSGEQKMKVLKFLKVFSDLGSGRTVKTIP